MQNKNKVHQLTIVDSSNLPWEIDIVPFGEIDGNNGAYTIAWPPDKDFVMSVMGFNEAFASALTVTITETPN